MNKSLLPVLLPRPAQIARLPGCCTLPRPFPLPAPCPEAGVFPWELKLLASALRAGPKITAPTAKRTDSPLALELRQTANPPAKGSPAEEAYELRITEKGVHISAAAPAGLRLGLRTLAQIIEQADAPHLRCLEISDKPALSWRGVHFDMKNVRFSLSYCAEIFDRLAAMKINVVVLEYENKFPFSRKLGVASADAYTPAEIGRLLALLRERGLTAVPLQQCFGHFAYVLQHPQYAHLREDGRFFAAPCPLLPESSRLVRRLLDEVAAFHPDAPWFHLGGDEARLGGCPKCAEKIKKFGRSRLYLDFVAPSCEHMLRRGYRPILWADLFLRHYQEIGRLAGKVTLMDWNYGATENARTAYFWPRYQDMTPADFQAYNASPAHKKEYAPFFPKADDKPFDALYTTRYLQSRGFEVLGAPAVTTGGGLWLPGLKQNVDNVLFHNRSAAAKGLPGTLNTRWATGVQHWEAVWPGLAAGAAFGWNPQISRQEFLKDFTQVFWGVSCATVLEACQTFGELKPLFTSAHWCNNLYDDTLGARNVRGELKERLAKESPAALEELSRQARKKAAELRAVAERENRRALRNRRTLAYFALAGAVLELRARQAEKMMAALQGQAVPASFWKKAVQENRLLKKRAAALLGDTLSKRSAAGSWKTLFGGEEELRAIAAPARLFEILPL